MLVTLPINPNCTTVADVFNTADEQLHWVLCAMNCEAAEITAVRPRPSVNTANAPEFCMPPGMGHLVGLGFGAGPGDGGRGGCGGVGAGAGVGCLGAGGAALLKSKHEHFTLSHSA